MSNKLNLQNAKLKILKLKEKYSRSINPNNIEPKSPSPWFNGSYVSSNVDIQHEIERKCFVVEPKVEFKGGSDDILNKIIKDHKLLNVGSGNQIVFKKAIDLNTTTTSDSSSQPSQNKTLSTESPTISNISNQLEQLCFLSSSSYDHIVKKEDYINKSELVHRPSSILIEENLSQSVPLSKNLKGINKQKLNLMLFHEVSDDGGSEKSTAHSKIISEMSSVEEMSSSLDNGSNKFDNSFKSQIITFKSEESDFKNISMTKTEGFRTSSEQSILKSNSFSRPVTEIKSKSKMENCDNQESVRTILPNMCSDEEVIDNQKVTKFKVDFSANSSDLTDITGDEIFGTGSEKSKCANGGVRRKNSDSSEYCDRCTKLKSSLRKKRSKQPRSTHCSLHTKPSLKRPMVKSCKLIKYDETYNEDFETHVHKARSRQCGLEDIFKDEKGRGMGCDEMIRKLLRCQIQLTRHFIESHHQMYLHCCQAVKILSENYSVQYTLPQ